MYLCYYKWVKNSAVLKKSREIDLIKEELPSYLLYENSKFFF